MELGPNNPSGVSKTDKLSNRNWRWDFFQAMRSIEKEKKIDYMREAILASLNDNNLRAQILKKILPDLSESEVTQRVLNIIRAETNGSDTQSKDI